MRISSVRTALILALAGPAAFLLPVRAPAQAQAARQTEVSQPAQESQPKRVRQHAANAEHPKQPHPAGIDRNGVIILVKSALMALDQANKTGNYTVLRDLSAPGFQVTNNAARLAEIFAKLRNDKLDLAGVAVIDPQLSLLPQIEANGMMHMAGFFPSVPSQVNFELMYAPVDGQWRLFGISVNVGQSAPAAPAAPPPAPEAHAKQPHAEKGDRKALPAKQPPKQ
jgi:hypothetical protein